VTTREEASVASRMVSVVSVVADVVVTAEAVATIVAVVEIVSSQQWTKMASKLNKAASNVLTVAAEAVVVEKVVVEATTKETASAKTMVAKEPWLKVVAEEDTTEAGLKLPSNRMRTTTKRRWQVNRSEAQVRQPEQAYLREHLNKKNKLKSDTLN